MTAYVTPTTLAVEMAWRYGDARADGPVGAPRAARRIAAEARARLRRELGAARTPYAGGGVGGGGGGEDASGSGPTAARPTARLAGRRGAPRSGAAAASL